MSKIISHIPRDLLGFGRCKITMLSRSSIPMKQYTTLGSTSRGYNGQNNILLPGISPSDPKIVQNRSLYTARALGLSKLQAIQEQRARSFETGRDRYIARIRSFMDQNDSKSIFKDDLINLIGLAETEDHLDLIDSFIKMIGPDQIFAFAGWGATVMRLYYKHKQLDRALKNINDPSIANFFNQRVSYQILMTMLFDAGRYQDVVDTYNLFKLRMQDLPDYKFKTDRRITVLVFAAYSKINTPEALKAAEELFTLDIDNPNMKLRVVSLVGHLALMQGEAGLALNIISGQPNKNYVTIRELKFMSLLSLGRHEDIVMYLRQLVDDMKPQSKLVMRKTYDSLRAVAKDADLHEILDDIEKSQLVDEACIEDILYRPIEERIPEEQAQEPRQRRSFNNKLNYH